MLVEKLSYLSNLTTENYFTKSFVKRKSMNIHIGNQREKLLQKCVWQLIKTMQGYFSGFCDTYGVYQRS